ncbi:MAG: hypothetical protein A2W90_00930 [Bacteroidetes bacterium GWF2_42_66]|nr:MAG: hypothetical protein A2W92_24370 [Bacteroidetes bacterium GWA2_42_15]OFX99418.1 MAG: hypothetical protein A2W89_12330 [Bacteroidetes bacterium GWE2_42_39]OFY40470.1 MAG: hypothetical protein A2W90_00930 [Bacteroidetes bacterium GWF2_42_66]HBL76907.1 hypothetical protein [Prolixibacteraceae bacterium]HCR92315.1 hypothetical protein [Prolixibacteraceae bacterium]
MSTKQRILMWLNIFLLVINISAFVTFLLMNKTSEKERDERFSSDEFLKTELGLSDDQYKKISALNSNVFRSYQAFLDYKCELNFKLIEELSSESPSDSVMGSWANNIGVMEANMKKQTIKHFENIKSICTEEQKLLLDQLLKDMLDAGEQCKYCNKVNCSRRDQLQKKK